MAVTLTNEQLAQLLQSAGQYGASSFAGPSFADQYNNFSAQGNTLKGLYDNKQISQEQFDTAKAGINAGKASAAVGGGLAIAGGITDILTNSFNMANINDTTAFQNQVDDIGRIGSSNYTSYDQLLSEYGKLSAAPGEFDYDEIRGGSTGERIGGVLSSTLSGATTGLTVGGPWGALAGAVIGLGAGVGGWIAGDYAADIEKQRLELQSKQNARIASMNLNAAGENIRNYDFRAGVARRAADGGKIERKEQSLQDFAARVLKKRNLNDITRRVGFVRQHCDGGTMIRIKR